METVAHGIGVTNRFELFYDEDMDPLEILRKQEEEKQKRKTEKTQVKGKPTKVGKTILTPKPEGQVKIIKTTDVEVPNKSKAKIDRPVRNPPEMKENEKNARNKDDQFFNSDQRENEFRRAARGGFRGRGGRERGRGYFANPDGRNRRVFDRHSGSDKTGVRPTEKRDGAGSNNWGDLRSDMTWDEDFAGEKKEIGEEDPNESTKFSEGNSGSKVSNDAVSDDPEPKDGDQSTEDQIQDAVKEMTLDEYKKEQEAKRVVPKYNLRKPGEGEDDKQWKKSYILKKKVEEEDQEDEEEMEDEDLGRKQQKVLLDLQFNFTDSRRGNRGRGRGGRGGPRGAGGRDNSNRDSAREDRPRENRGGRGGAKIGQQAAPRVDDFNDFPSLANA